MSTFTLAISCLTTSNLPWFVDLTFQVPMHCCSLQHQALLQSPVPSTDGCCFCSGSIPSLSGVVSLISSSILGTYWPGVFLFQCPIICLLILFMGFSGQEYWSGFPFPSPVDHILSISTGSSKKQESSRKPSISALLTMWKSLTVWITINWKILKEMGIPDHLTCLLRNLYAGQEAAVRIGHGTTDWFQIGKGVRQGCILSPCLFNFYAEYIMRNTGLEEAQAGIKIAGRNTNNLRYADNTTLMAESEEELKNLLMKVKVEKLA